MPKFWIKRQQRRPGLMRDESAMGTLEVVIIIAALLALAILFNTQIRAFADRAFQLVFNDSRIVDVLGE